MKVELQMPLGKALLKGRLWRGESEVSPEGEEDEASQQPTLHHQLRSAAKVSKGSSGCIYL